MQSNKTSKEKEILRKYKHVFDALEEYDRTGKLPFDRKRLDITLPVEVIEKLNELKKNTGKPISKIIEEKFRTEDHKRTEKDKWFREEHSTS